MKRRDLLLSGAAFAVAGSLNKAAAATGVAPGDKEFEAAWNKWKTKCLDGSGRVVDGPQQRASHSEGQGYGMTLAAHFGDKAAFAKMFAWTESNLAVRPDNLLAWRFLPNVDKSVPDKNNATDGDLFYAWALMLAYRRWGTVAYAHRAKGIAQSIRDKCLAPMPGNSTRTLLLPGANGFVLGGNVVVNLSYCMPRALRDLGQFSGIVELSDAADQGLALMARVARKQLIPNWLQVTPNGFGPADGLSYDCGYDALRVPLFLAWSGITNSEAQIRFRDAHGRSDRLGKGVVTVFDSVTEKPKQWSTEAGYQALVALNACVVKRIVGSTMPDFTVGQPYYPSTLQLMALLAQAEFYPTCVPI